jgi:FlaA1/EpsC-like NDP-sugar epimerase
MSRNSYPFGTFIPKWGVLIFDVFIVSVSFALAYLISHFEVSSEEEVILICSVTILAFLISFFIFKPYSIVIRYFIASDLLLILYSSLLGTGVSVLFSLAYFKSSELIMLIINSGIYSLLFLILYRIIVNVLRQNKTKTNSLKNVMIFGAGQFGQITKDLIEKDESLKKRVLYFIDDNPNLQGKKCKNIKVLSFETAVDELALRYNITEIIFAIKEQNISPTRKQEIINLCLTKNIKVKKILEPKDWMQSDSPSANVVDIKIEDLLERDPISISEENIKGAVFENTILITGAAGSIGSEIVRQLLKYSPKTLILVDQAESGLYDLKNELKATKSDIITEVADVTDKYRIEGIFEYYRPKMIFHAAAYKHVPMMEKLPYEALKVNIGGTKNLADLALKYEVAKFVMVSTDKAVNPTNVMGATKRICELYTQSMSQLENIKTEFITTRFGNVLGSSGSVVPIFRRQIASGGPLTVTHKDITRFFMTIPEACQLVLEAGMMGNNGEIYVFDMGKPVKIYDLAKKMILLSGFVPDKDIEIKITGLRQGEKLFEELLASKEKTLPTHHEKIYVAKVRKNSFSEINSQVNELLQANNNETDFELVLKMKEIVPEFISQNSRFSIQNK